MDLRLRVQQACRTDRVVTLPQARRPPRRIPGPPQSATGALPPWRSRGARAPVRSPGRAPGDLGLAGGAHRLHRRGRPAGHQLDLAGRLVQEQVEAADHDAAGLRGRGRGQRRGPGRVDHVEARPRRAAARPVRRNVGGTGRHGGDDQVAVAASDRRTAAGQPSRPAGCGSQQVSPARAGSRTTTSAASRPVSRRAASGGAGGRARAEDTAGAGARSRRLGQRRDHAGTSVLYAVPRAAREHHRVGPAHLDGERLGAVSSSGSTARFSGMVSDSPRPLRSQPAIRAASPASSHSIAVVASSRQAERGVRGPVQHRRQRVRDRRARAPRPASAGAGQLFAELVA